MRIILSIILCVTFLIARENPFESVITPQESGKVAEIKKPTYFTREIMSLPSTARKVKRIEIWYQNMDGSIDSVMVETDRDIDWHFPMVVTHDTQNQVVRTKTAMTQSKSAAPRMSASEPKLLPAPKNNKATLSALPYISFGIDGKKLMVMTQDSMLREFDLAEPTKIVMDFKRNTTFYTKTLKTNKMYFEEIALGNHKGYYRVAIKLDGKYRYQVNKSENGYLLELE